MRRWTILNDMEHLALPYAIGESLKNQPRIGGGIRDRVIIFRVYYTLRLPRDRTKTSSRF